MTLVGYYPLDMDHTIPNPNPLTLNPNPSPKPSPKPTPLTLTLTSASATTYYLPLTPYPLPLTTYYLLLTTYFLPAARARRARGIPDRVRAPLRGAGLRRAGRYLLLTTYY